MMIVAVRCAAQDAVPADPWFSTFSIVAFDPATNELGVGVQSARVRAGAAVPFARPGVGAGPGVGQPLLGRGRPLPSRA
jgi:hypothetical protein